MIETTTPTDVPVFDPKDSRVDCGAPRAHATITITSAEGRQVPLRLCLHHYTRHRAVLTPKGITDGR